MKLTYLNILILITSLASCGPGDDASKVTTKLGTSLIKCQDCGLKNSEVTILKNICESFSNKINNFKNISPEFKFNIEAKNCTGGVVTAPIPPAPAMNNLFLNIQVSNSSFVINNAKTTSGEYILDFESHDYGVLKTLCAIKDEAIVKSQIEDGEYLFSYEFFGNKDQCGLNSSNDGYCFLVNMAKKTLAGQYIIKKSELISVIKDKDNKIPHVDGVVSRRERASLCFDEINTSTITQQLDSIN